MSTVRIQVRRGVSTGTGSWNAINPTLADGEIGLETDTGKFKFGYNDTAWNDLPYALEDTLTDYLPVSLKGTADGLAELDSSGYVPVTQLPPLAKVTVSSVADQTARLALTAEVGDIAIQTDTGASYVLQTAGASTNANWKELVSNEKVQDVVGGMLSGNTETGITVTYQDSDGTIDFEVADQFSTHSTSDLSEGTNKYFTDERAQDAIGNSLGSGLSYNDSTGAISVDTSTIQARVTDISDTEIGYLNGVTSSIQNQIDGKLSTTGGTVTGAITLPSNPTSDLHAATKAYVDNVTAGINFHEAVHAATITNLATIYDNGTSGVGATLTANTNRAFSTLDGESVVLGQRVLIKNQTDAKQNGIYTLTTAGSVSVPWVLTRATDADNNPTGEMKTGDFVFVMNGAVNASVGYINNSTASPIVIGTDNISYTEFNAGKAVTAGYGLTESTPGTIAVDSFITQNAETQTLTNKTIYLSNNTIVGSTSEFNTALSDGNFATLDGTETLTGKTLTSPKINEDVAVSATATELNILDGAQITTQELNILSGLTATSAELNILDGVTASFTEINILDGATLSTTELNYVDGVTSAIQTQLDDKQPKISGVSDTELGYLDGVTSAIQTQLNGKQATVANVSDVEIGYLDGVTSSIQTQIDGKQAIVSGVSSTEIGYLDGVTSAIQTQIDTKAPIASPTFTGHPTIEGVTATGATGTGKLVFDTSPTIASISGITTLNSVAGGSTNLFNSHNTNALYFGANQTTGSMSFGGAQGTVNLLNTAGTVNKTVNIATASTGGTTAITIGSSSGATSNITLNGTISLPSTTSIGNVSATEIGYVDGVTSAIQTQLDDKLSKTGGTMTGALTLSGAPTVDLHAATKAYVDNVVSGLNFHQPVRVATTANITLSGTQTIDGVSLSVGDRVLVKDQTDQKTNGIYVVASSTWSRATDADNTPDGELKGGDFTLVLEGTVGSGYGYVCSNTSAITIGTTNVTYAAFNAAKAITAGSGLTESTPGTIDIATGGVTSAMIADGTIVNGDISASAAIAYSKLNLASSITSSDIVDGTIVNADINASAAIATSKISGLDTALSTKAPLADPTFTGTVTVAASGIAFTDGTQTKEAVVSRTPIIQKTAAYTLSVLTERDSLIEISSATGVTLTIPTNAAVAYPVGTSIDILQTSTGQVTIAGDTGVTVNATPGLKLRTQWSSVTLFKRATNTWVVYGDLTA